MLSLFQITKLLYKSLSELEKYNLYLEDQIMYYQFKVVINYQRIAKLRNTVWNTESRKYTFMGIISKVKGYSYL